ncbi:MAG: hypothetical protein V1809_14605 [Planctomycetota bacterium]
MWWNVILGLTAPLGLIAMLQAFKTAGFRPAPRPLFLFIAALEALAVTIHTPLLLAALRNQGRRHERLIILGIRETLFFAGWIGVALIAGVVFGGRGEFRGFLLAQPVLVGFAAILTGMFALAAGTGLASAAAQLAATTLGFAMLGILFYANPAIQSVPTEAARESLIRLAIHANPVAALSGPVFEYDLLRAPRMYDISVIGSYYRFAYPAWGTLLAEYLAAGTALVAAGAALERLRRPAARTTP